MSTLASCSREVIIRKQTEVELKSGLSLERADCEDHCWRWTTLICSNPRASPHPRGQFCALAQREPCARSSLKNLNLAMRLVWLCPTGSLVPPPLGPLSQHTKRVRLGIEAVPCGGPSV